VKIVAGRIEVGTDVAEHGADIEIVGELGAELRREGPVVVIVGIELTAGRHQPDRRHVGLARMVMREVEVIGERPTEPLVPTVWLKVLYDPPSSPPSTCGGPLMILTTTPIASDP
jgi:hypothetical protein